ncbi:MAG: hypothetical protein KGI52_08565 [Burkholderiales bacterium]|nr:hypothetical protein [Burkholderiales bacterium]
MSREAFGDPPESQEAPDLCPVCGNDWHAEDCVLGKEVALRLKAERDAHQLAHALENVAMMLRKCARRLRRNGHEDLSADAVGLLRRLDLLGSPLREAKPMSAGKLASLAKEPFPGCKTPDGCRENSCLGWCDEYRPDPALKPDIAALKKRLAEDPGFAAQVTGDRPPTPVGWSDTDWLKHLEEIRQDQAVYHRGPLPETGWD